MAKKYLLYLIRWQLSTPILAIVLIVLAGMSTILATVIANLIGGLIFFWIDRFIFKTTMKNPVWEIQDHAVCAECGSVGEGYRVVEWFWYNRVNDKNPQFRCVKCKDIKLQEIRKKIKAKDH